MIALLAFSNAVPPLDPSAAEARAMLLRELAKSEYASARPDWFQLLQKAIFDWLDSLSIPGLGDSLPLGLIVLCSIAAVAIVVAFLVFGVPRLRRRSAVAGALFGSEDARDAAALRAAAARAAAAEDYQTAIAEQFRAVARGLAERTVVTTFPGTTAHDFATQAAASFPDSVAALRGAAASFDGVRYLGGAGSEAEWRAIAELDWRLRDARPLLEAIDA